MVDDVLIASDTAASVTVSAPSEIEVQRENAFPVHRAPRTPCSKGERRACGHSARTESLRVQRIEMFRGGGGGTFGICD